MDQLANVCGELFARLAAALQQDAPDDADGTLSVFLDLGQVFLQVGRNVLEIVGIVFFQLLTPRSNRMRAGMLMSRGSVPGREYWLNCLEMKLAWALILSPFNTSTEAVRLACQSGML